MELTATVLDGEGSDGRTEAMVRAGLLPGWVCVAVTLLVFLPGLVLPAWGHAVALPTWARYAPLVASVLLFGLPHGAVDHVTVPWARGMKPDAGWYAVVGAVYAAVGGAYLLLWAVAPASAFVLFVVVTWLHWGQGDVYHLVELLPRTHLGSRLDRVRAALVRGALPMFVPLVAFPGRYRRVAETIVGLFDPAAVAALAPVFEPGVRTAVGAVLALATVGHVVRTRPGSKSGGRRAWLLDTVELALLWAFFAAVPPVLAVGLYFTLWHSLRHVVRAAGLDPRNRPTLERGLARPALVRFARTAAPLSAGALAVVVGLWVIVPNPPTDVPSAVGLYLVAIAALTLPHVVFAGWLDGVEGVWSLG